MELLIVGLGSMGKRRARLLKGIDKNIALSGVDTAPSRREEAAALGVEGFDVEALRQAVLNAGGRETAQRAGRAITYGDLYAWGLSGTAGSREERYDFLKRLGLPPRLSKKALCDVLNSLYTWEEINEMQNGPQRG